jgi:PTS system galactitol-specific IIC component
MGIIQTIFEYLSGLGSYVMIPIVITLVCLGVGVKFSKALQSGMTIGIGLIGLNLVLNLIWENITPITEILIERFGINFNTIDIGWPAGAGLAYSTLIGTFIIPFTIVLNLVLLMTRVTKTANIDIWNYWHYAFTGSLIHVVTKNIPLSFLGAATHCVLSLVFADLAAKRVQKTLGIPGITVTGGEVTGMLPVVILMDKIYDLIFGRKDAREAELEAGEEATGGKKIFGMIRVTLGQPTFLGAIIGTILAILSGYSVSQILNVAISMAALMYLLPRMVQVLMEGFIPMSNQARNFMQKKFKDSGREIFIGMDSAVLIGLPTAATVGLMLIPVTLLLSIIVPFNTTLPMGDLPGTCYMVTFATAFHARNGKPKLLRVFITGVIIMALALPISSAFAPMLTEVAKANAMDIPQGALMVTCLEGNLFAYALFKFLTMNIVPIGVVLCIILGVAGVVFSKWMQKREEIQLAATANQSTD